MLHLTTYYGRPEMARQIIGNPQGQLLINSLDLNNDSPIQLAAYRKQSGIYMMLAQNNAFLDQPNAGGEDAIDAIQDPAEKQRLLQEMLKIPTLSEGSKKRIALEMKKNQPQASQPPLGQTPTKPLASTMVNSQVPSEKKEGHYVFEKVMSNQNQYIQGTGEMANRETRAPTRTAAVTMKNLDVGSLGDLEFELAMPGSEYLPEEEVSVVSIMPGSGFFYLPKSTAFDQLGP